MSDTPQEPDWQQPGPSAAPPGEPTGPPPDAPPTPQTGPPPPGGPQRMLPSPGPGLHPGAGPGPQQWSQPGRAYGAPEKKHWKKAVWIAAAVASVVIIPVFIGGCFVVLAVSNSGGNDAVEEFAQISPDISNEGNDIEVLTGESGSCLVTEVNITSDYRVEITITNENDIRASYVLNYELFGPDGTSLGTDSGAIPRVDPGQIATELDFNDIRARDGLDISDISCEVTEVRSRPAT